MFHKQTLPLFRGRFSVQRVKSGRLLAKVGTTGQERYPRAKFEIWEYTPSSPNPYERTKVRLMWSA